MKSTIVIFPDTKSTKYQLHSILMERSNPKSSVKIRSHEDYRKILFQRYVIKIYETLVFNINNNFNKLMNKTTVTYRLPFFTSRDLDRIRLPLSRRFLSLDIERDFDLTIFLRFDLCLCLLEDLLLLLDLPMFEIQSANLICQDTNRIRPLLTNGDSAYA